MAFSWTDVKNRLEVLTHSVAWKLSQQLCEISERHNQTFMFLLEK